MIEGGVGGCVSPANAKIFTIWPFGEKTVLNPVLCYNFRDTWNSLLLKLILAHIFIECYYPPGTYYCCCRNQPSEETGIIPNL